MAVSVCLSVSPQAYLRNYTPEQIFTHVTYIRVYRLFTIFCTFFLPVCVYYVMYYFVMGGQLRWANASTGSLPL